MDNVLDIYRKRKKYVLLSEDEKRLIVELLGSGKSNSKTAEIFKELTGKEIAPPNVQYYRSTRRDAIATIKEERLKNQDLTDMHFADPMARIVALSDVAEELLRTKQYPEFRRTLHEISVQLGEQSPQVLIQNIYENIQRKGGRGIEVVMVNLREAVGDADFIEIQSKLDQKYLGELEVEVIPNEEEEDV